MPAFAGRKPPIVIRIKEFQGNRGKPGPVGPPGSSIPVGDTMVIGEIPVGTIDGANAAFTLAHTPSGAIMLWRGYILMYPGTHYNLSGNTITYTAGNQPETGDAHMALYQY